MKDTPGSGAPAPAVPGAQGPAEAPRPEIALFPLNTVLCPGGLLPLRIFETRYVDMVGRCMREELPFGVVLIRAGSDVDPEVAIAAVGTAARIVDFQALPDGLLGLLCRGERRFRVLSTRVLNDGLNMASIEWLPDPPVALSGEYRALVPVLRQVLQTLEDMARFIEPRYEDAGWVGYRFTELLPLDRELQQQLLELVDPNERLKWLAPLIEAERPEG